MQVSSLNINHFQLVIFVLLISVLLSCNKTSHVTATYDNYFPEFEKNWELYTKSSKGGWKNNFNGRFSWDDAYALEALVLHFERSKDKRYIDTFIKVATRIFNSTDDNLNLRNKHRGNRIVKGWSTTRYTQDSSFHVFGITNAMILYPILKLHNILNENNLGNESYSHFFTKALNFSLLEFEDINVKDWINKSHETGYFQDAYYSNIGITTPVNQYARIGSYAIELYKLTREINYLNYAQKVARHLKKNLIHVGDYFYWNYTITNNPSPNDQPDDLGHSILVVQFIVNCYKNNIVFDKNDVQSLVKLFKNQVNVPNTILFNEYLNGNIISNDPFISHYYMLSEFDSEIHLILSNWLNQQVFNLDLSSFLNHFGNKLILLNAMNLYYKRF